MSDRVEIGFKVSMWITANVPKHVLERKLKEYAESHMSAEDCLHDIGVDHVQSQSGEVMLLSGDESSWSSWYREIDEVEIEDWPEGFENCRTDSVWLRIKLQEPTCPNSVWDAIARLGIVWDRVIPQSLGDQMWIIGCRNVPDELPEWLEGMEPVEGW
jgi:hypothetical protein